VSLCDYEEAARVRINTKKSHALAVGSWDKSIPIMDIQYCEVLKILGFNMRTTTKASASKSWAYLTARIRANAQDAPKACKRLLHTLNLSSLQAASVHSDMRIARLWRNIDWRRLWKTLSEAPVSEVKIVAWYQVIHEIIPTNERLHRKIWFKPYACRHCVAKDTLEHRLIVCGVGKLVIQIYRPQHIDSV